ncbi:MAG: hypothetical protein R2877_03140 [Bdellovibrionota bacterium]
MSKPLFTVGSMEVSIRDIVMIVGGLFLFMKAVKEIYNFAEAKDIEEQKRDEPLSTKFSVVVGTIIFFDFIFSFDSVLDCGGLGKAVVDHDHGRHHRHHFHVDVCGSSLRIHREKPKHQTFGLGIFGNDRRDVDVGRI